MLDDAVALRAAWTDQLASLDVDGAELLVMSGVAAEITAESFPLPIADAVEGVVTLGRSAPSLEDGATMASTGLPDGSVEACVMLDTWSSLSSMADAAREARRITQRSGRIWMGAIDADALVSGTPATWRSAAFYGTRGFAPVRTPGVSLTSMVLLRIGLREIETSSALLPVAAFGDADAYVAAVLSGMWFGVEDLSVPERAQLESELLRGLAREEMPIVEYRPWELSRARKR